MAEQLPSAAEARAVIERGLRTLRAFQDADRALALLENMEQVATERRAAIEALKAEQAMVEQAVADAKAELASAKKKAKELTGEEQIFSKK